jgi:sugar phosphate isomerase/epimerase
VKYSYDSLVYYGETVADSIARVAKFGYDAIELIGEPAQYDVAQVNELCRQHGVEVSSICSIYFGDERDLVAVDPENRRKAVQYTKDVIDLAAGVGAGMVIVRPAPFGKISPGAAAEIEWEWAVAGLRESADHAESKHVRLCIEAWNRYETYFANRLDDCLKLMRAVDRRNVGVMGDTFHMAIEEESIADAYRRAGKDLFHVHFADSNRAAPGRGHTDFVPIVKVLIEIGYQGYISFELLPAAADVFGTLKSGGGKEFFDDYTRLAIETVKRVEAQVEAQAATV